MTNLPKSNRILGVDPGLNITGYGVVAREGSSLRLVEAGVIRSKRSDTLETRLRDLHAGMTELIAAAQPGAMAVEQLYTHYERPQTAILMGHARGVICLAAAAVGIPVRHFAATQIKKILTGSGRASKAQVQRAICREFQLAEPPEPHDVADALAIALCDCYSQRDTFTSTSQRHAS